MKFEYMTTEELQEYAMFLDAEILRIRHEYDVTLPELKHTLVKVQHELSTRSV